MARHIVQGWHFLGQRIRCSREPPDYSCPSAATLFFCWGELFRYTCCSLNLDLCDNDRVWQCTMCTGGLFWDKGFGVGIRLITFVLLQTPFFAGAHFLDALCSLNLDLCDNDMVWQGWPFLGQRIRCRDPPDYSCPPASTFFAVYCGKSLNTFLVPNWSECMHPRML